MKLVLTIKYGSSAQSQGQITIDYRENEII